jgi:hypothetical protein
MAEPGPSTTPQGAGGLSLDVLMNAFGKVTDSIDASMNDLRKTTEQGTGAVAAQQEAIKAAAEGQVTVNIENEKAALKQKSDNARVATAFGMNPDSGSYIIDLMGRSILAREQDIQARDKMIQAKMDTGFIDDPLSWIANQFTLPMDVQSLNNSISEQSRELGVLKELQDRTTTAYVVNAGIDTAASESRLAGLNAITLGKAANDVAQSQERLAQLGIQAINVRQQLTGQQFSAVLQINNALWAKESHELQLKNYYLNEKQLELAISSKEAQLEYQKRQEDRAERSFQLQKEYRDLMIEDRKDNMVAKAALQEKLNNVTDVLGMNRFTIEEFKLLSGPTKAALESAMSDPDMQSGRIGYNAADSLSKANTLNAPLTPSINLVRKNLIAVQNRVMSSDPLWSQKKQGEQIAAIQAEIEKEVGKEIKSIPEQGGIYSPPPLIATLTIPAVQNTQLAKALAPLGTVNSQYPTKADDVYRAAISLIEEGKGTPASMAREIALMYNAIILDNNDNKQYQRLALPRMSQASGFRTNVQSDFGWGNSRVINMADPAAVEAALMRTVIHNQRTRAPETIEQGVP